MDGTVARLQHRVTVEREAALWRLMRRVLGSACPDEPMAVMAALKERGLHCTTVIGNGHQPVAVVTDGPWGKHFHELDWEVLPSFPIDKAGAFAEAACIGVEQSGSSSGS